MPSVAGLAHAPSTPDWATVADEILCPLCDYNLRGLTEPRCPECGYQFAWRELLDINRRAHPYLFEHHPERNVWSLFRTLIGGLRPAAFWRSLHPSQPSRPRRIALYAIICLLPVLITFAATAVLIFNDAYASLYGRMTSSGQGVPDLWWSIRYIARWRLHTDGLLAVLGGIVLWPWLTMAGLMIFRWSMRRARIRRVHVVRCVVYSADLLLLLTPFYALVLAMQYYDAPSLRNSPFDYILPAAAILLWICFVYRLMRAYRHYLRFDHVAATVLVSQVMAALVVWKLLLIAEGY